MHKNLIWFSSLVVILLTFVTPAYAADVVQLGINGYRHLPGVNLTVLGSVYSGTVPVAASDVSIYVAYINGTAYSNHTATTDNSGLFSKSFAVNAEGDFVVRASYLSASSENIHFEVSNVADYKGESGSGGIEIPLGTGWSGNATNWNTTMLHNGTMNISGTTYYVLAENASNAAGTGYACSDIFIDDDRNFNFTDSSEDGTGITEIKYMGEDDKFLLNDTYYKVIFTDTNCTQAAIVANPTSAYGGGESRTLVVEPVGSSGQPVNVTGNVTYEIYNEDGNLVQNGTTNSTQWNYTIPGEAGTYYIYADGENVDSFSVSKFTVKAKILDEGGKDVSAVASGRQLNITVAVINATTSSPITNAVVNATSTSGGFYSFTYSSANGYYYSTITSPSVAEELYDISVSAAGNVQRTTLMLQTRSFLLTAFPLSSEKGESDGFAPSQPGVIIITATNMTDGSALNLSTATNNCNLTLLNIVQFTNSTGSNVLAGIQSSINSMNITTAFDVYNVPDFVREEAKSQLGSYACVINFTVPDTVGMYTARIRANISNSVENADVPIVVQDIFASASPMDLYDAFRWYVSPQERIYLKITIFDAATGSEIAAQNITSASLIEVVTENGTIVTKDMLNETFSNSVTVGWSSTGQPALSFIVNDSLMGGHMVRFMVKARVQRGSQVRNITGVGSGWFMEKKYHVFGWPETSGGNWYFGENDNITFIVNVYNSESFASYGQAKSGNETGSSDLQNIAVTIDEIRDPFTWKKIDFNSTSNTTDTKGQARVVVSRSSAWPTGSYNARIKITKSGVEDYGFTWFEVRSFMFWAWTNNWQVGSRQAAPITGQVYNASWTAISGATVNITKIIYHGRPEAGRWTYSEVSFNTSNPNITATTGSNGMATVIIPQNTLIKSGEYEAVLTATLASGSTQTANTWFSVKAFVMFANDFTKTEYWNPSYRAGANITLNITGGTSINWSKWPVPVDGEVNISSAWMSKVEKEGMFGPFMKKDSRSGQTTITQSTTCNGNSSTCQLRINTTGMDVGRYFGIIMANNTYGDEESTWFSFEIKSYTITTPELKRVSVKTLSNYTYTNASSITTNSSWLSCSSSQVSPPSIVKECKAITNYTFTEEPNAPMYSIMIDTNSTNANTRRLYINTNYTSLNFTAGTVSNYSIGQNFSIRGVWYRIINITDTVKLESNNTVGADNDGNGKADYDKSGSGCQNRLCLLNVSDSSGKYYLKREEWSCWECFSDDQWLGIDLNGDGNYWDSDDSYYLAVQTYPGSGAIRNVYANNASTFASGTGAKTYPGATPANFSPSGTSIYYVGASYRQEGSSGGTSTGSTRIEVTFTSNRTGWMGMEIGTFKSGTNISVPIMVLDPDRVPVSGAVVNISRAVVIEAGPPTEIGLSSSGVATTDSRGVAIVVLNSSWFSNPYTGGSSGRYAIKVRVNASGVTSESTGMPWEWPRVEIANFRLRVEPGLMGQITGLKRLSAATGTLVKLPAYEIVLSSGMSLETACSDSNVLRPTDWRYQKLYINRSYSNTTVIVDTDNDCVVNGSDTGDRNVALGSILNLTYATHTEYMNVSSVLFAGNYTFNLSCTACSSDSPSQLSRYNEVSGIRYYLKNVVCQSGVARASVRRTDPEWNWNWDIDQNSVPNALFWDWKSGGYELNMTLIQNNSDCSTANVSFTWLISGMELKNPWNLPLGGNWKIAKIANSSATGQYQLLIFDNSSVRNGENAICESWGFNCTRADTVLVINSTGDIKGTYYYGDLITELNMRMFAGQLWEDKVYLANTTDAIPFPVEWFADGTEDFWTGSFTETDINQDLNNMGWCQPGDSMCETAERQPNASQTYYMLLYDNMWDNSQAVSGGMYDNDRDMLERCTWSGGHVCYDLYGSNGKYGGQPTELGENRTYGGGGGGEPFTESWIRFGEDNWPITFLSLNTSNTTNGIVKTQSKKEVFNLTKGERVSFAIRATNLDGTSFNGNASVTEVFDMMNFVPVALPNDTVVISNGEGVLTLNSFTNKSNGGYIMKVRVCDQSSPPVCESMERPIFIGRMEFMACKHGEVCGGEGGGSGGGGMH